MRTRTLAPALLGLLLAPACKDKEETGQESPPPEETGETGETGEPDETGDTGDTSETGESGETGDNLVTITQIQSGEVPPDTLVRLEGVVVSSPNTGSGFFVADPDGGPYSGLWVYHRGYLEFFEAGVGDEISLEGVVNEYAAEGYEGTLTELEVMDVADATVTGEGVLPAPVLLSTEQLADAATAEMYESVLVSVQDVVVTGMDDEFGEWRIDDLVAVDDLFYDVEDLIGVLGEGDIFSQITGPLYFSYGAFKLAPRDAEDLQGFTRYCAAALCIDDLAEGDLAVTEVLANPDYCADPNGEYIEVRNETDDQVDLFGLELSDAAGPVLLDEHVVVAPGAYVWLANGSSPTIFCYATLGEPDAYYGSSLGLNNDAETITLGYTGESSSVVIDTLSWDSSSFATRGVAMGLDDASGEWCAQSTPIGDTTDLGTPGAVNDPCE